MSNRFIFAQKTGFGVITITANKNAITGLFFENEIVALSGEIKETILIHAAFKELNAYFEGELREFSLPLAPKGTSFQQTVWQALLTIPYGQTRSYGAIAKQIGSCGAARAVGLANNRNPIPIMIPCHRVIGADGCLVGYGSGLAIKKKLLTLEGVSGKWDSEAP